MKRPWEQMEREGLPKPNPIPDPVPNLIPDPVPIPDPTRATLHEDKLMVNLATAVIMGQKWVRVYDFVMPTFRAALRRKVELTWMKSTTRNRIFQMLYHALHPQNFARAEYKMIAKNAAQRQALEQRAVDAHNLLYASAQPMPEKFAAEVAKYTTTTEVLPKDAGILGHLDAALFPRPSMNRNGGEAARTPTEMEHPGIRVAYFDTLGGRDLQEDRERLATLKRLFHKVLTGFEPDRSVFFVSEMIYGADFNQADFFTMIMELFDFLFNAPRPEGREFPPTDTDVYLVELMNTLPQVIIEELCLDDLHMNMMPFFEEMLAKFSNVNMEDEYWRKERDLLFAVQRRYEHVRFEKFGTSILEPGKLNAYRESITKGRTLWKKSVVDANIHLIKDYHYAATMFMLRREVLNQGPGTIEGILDFAPGLVGIRSALLLMAADRVRFPPNQERTHITVIIAPRGKWQDWQRENAQLFDDPDPEKIETMAPEDYPQYRFRFFECATPTNVKQLDVMFQKKEHDAILIDPIFILDNEGTGNRIFRNALYVRRCIVQDTDVHMQFRGSALARLLSIYRQDARHRFPCWSFPTQFGAWDHAGRINQLRGILNPPTSALDRPIDDVQLAAAWFRAHTVPERVKENRREADYVGREQEEAAYRILESHLRSLMRRYVATLVENRPPLLPFLHRAVYRTRKALVCPQAVRLNSLLEEMDKEATQFQVPKDERFDMKPISKRWMPVAPRLGKQEEKQQGNGFITLFKSVTSRFYKAPDPVQEEKGEPMSMFDDAAVDDMEIEESFTYNMPSTPLATTTNARFYHAGEYIQTLLEHANNDNVRIVVYSNFKTVLAYFMHYLRTQVTQDTSCQACPKLDAPNYQRDDIIDRFNQKMRYAPEDRVRVLGLLYQTVIYEDVDLQQVTHVVCLDQVYVPAFRAYARAAVTRPDSPVTTVVWMEFYTPREADDDLDNVQTLLAQGLGAFAMEPKVADDGSTRDDKGYEYPVTARDFQYRISEIVGFAQFSERR